MIAELVEASYRCGDQADAQGFCCVEEFNCLAWMTTPE
jgi:hypothetical protein